MTSAFAPDGSEPMGRKLATNQLRDRATLIQDFYKLDLVEQFLVGYEGEFWVNWVGYKLYRLGQNQKYV